MAVSRDWTLQCCCFCYFAALVWRGLQGTLNPSPRHLKPHSASGADFETGGGLRERDMCSLTRSPKHQTLPVGANWCHKHSYTDAGEESAAT